MVTGPDSGRGRATRRRLATMIASVGGAGRFPVSPGSAGSLVAVLAGWPLLLLPAWALIAAALVATLGGWWAVTAAEIRGDPGWVVIDEVAGQWIAMLALAAPTIPGLALAFLLFRVLDVTKIGPIGWADRQSGAIGVMLDDVIAGGIAAALLLALRLEWPGLLGS